MPLAPAAAVGYLAPTTGAFPAMHQVVERVPSPCEPRTSRLEVRRVTALSAAELEEAVLLLTAAFDGSPLFQLAFPQQAMRRKMVQILFAATLKDALRFGRVEIAYNGRLAGVLVWYPPALYPLSLPRTLRLLPDYLRIAVATPAGIIKLFRAHMTLNRVRPSEPHCHGYFLGGRPGEQVGSILGRRVLHIADEVGHPIYLETQDRRTVSLYMRLGFTMLQDGIETVPGGPLTWTMWREPRLAKPRLAESPLEPRLAESPLEPRLASSARHAAA
jgi:hypothetical protein